MMRWTSYLVLHLPEVSTMPDWMQRPHRADVIMRGYIYPQIEDKLIADGKANDDDAFDQMIDELKTAVRDMAIQDKHDGRRCEQPIMMWDRLSDLVSETLSTHPTKQEICNLRARCYDVFYGTFSMDLDLEAELWQTVGALDTLLKHWDENTAQLLRFYSRTSRKTARFNRYAI
jgi:hypothetical protein